MDNDLEKMRAVLVANPKIGREKLIRATGVSAWSAQQFLTEREKHLAADTPPAPPGPGDDIETEYAKDKASVTTKSTKIDTLEKALEAAQVDMAVWEVEKHTVNWWDVTMKQKDGSPRTITNFQIKVFLRRKAPAPLFEALRSLADEVRQQGPIQLLGSLPQLTDPHLLEISIFDLHFGKLAWAAETGTDYDIKEAERLFIGAVSVLLERSQVFGIDRILMPIGSDFLHVNSSANMTAAGTPQDVDTRLAKIFKRACSAVIRAVDMAAEIAPVEVIFVPGNHDRDTAFYLCSYLEAWYHRHEGVAVDVSPTSRKYVRYGCNLLGFTHGDEEKPADLPLLMAGERPYDWAGTTSREWHIGHLHKSKETRFVVGDTQGPVILRILPSLSGTDAWHYRKGYVGGRRAAESYIWSFMDGYAGHFSSNLPVAA